MGRITATLYARVSSDGQARGNTVASQLAALREQVAADGAAVGPEHAYVDEGCSGATLARPALERLRDAVAAGEVDRVYVHAPDRLARRYAYQVLLVEEFRRAGVEMAFLNRAIGGSAEDDLLLQVQGVIADPVPAIVEPGLFEAAQAQLDENRRRKREGRRRPGWLLQGLVVCRRCGYVFYGKMARGVVGGRRPADYGYYRCTGTDGHKFGGHARCDNRSVRSDKLEQAVWRQVEAVLDNPARVAAEHERRAASARDGKAREDVDVLDRQISRLRRGMGRLIDGYAEEVIDADEFKPRLSGLKQRLARLQAERDAAAAAHEAERSLQLVIGRLDEFARRVRVGLEELDWHGQREVIRALVRRVEIDHDQVEVVFRIPGAPPPDRSATPGSGPDGVGKSTPVRQHRGRGYHRPVRQIFHLSTCPNFPSHLC